MSPQALSRHLRVLRRAGLVSEQGSRTMRASDLQRAPDCLQPGAALVAQVEDLWRRHSTP